MMNEKRGWSLLPPNPSPSLSHEFLAFKKIRFELHRDRYDVLGVVRVSLVEINLHACEEEAFLQVPVRRSIRNVFPAYFVANDVEGAVKYRGKEDQANHGQAEFLCSQYRGAQKELSPQKHHDCKGQRVEERCL